MRWMQRAEAAPPDARPTSRTQTLACRAIAVALIAWFVSSVAGFYHPGTGFTSLIGFAAHDYEVPAMAQAPHFDAAAGYDGQFYAQLALVPFLTDPAIDRALDNPPYRARRILFSWTAYLIGLGRPAWILQVYALQNVACWFVLAWVLMRWVSPDTPRGLALWAACLFSQGLLVSVRLALTDGPSTLCLALAAWAADRHRLWLTSAIVGMGALGRETSLLGISLLRMPRDRRGWLRTLMALAVIMLPLLIWQDYLWSIYRTTSWTNQNLFAAPFASMFHKWQVSIHAVARDGVRSPHMWALAATLGLTVQAIFVATRTNYMDVWWRLAAPCVVLMAVLAWEVWAGIPGAAVRALLPMTIGFNVLLRDASRRSMWLWYGLGNIGLLHAPAVLHNG